MNIFDINEHFESEIISDFKKFISKNNWFSGIPGGFITNSPKRKVTTFGDGSSIDCYGNFSSSGMESSYWTAGINSSHVSLCSKPLKMPDIFCKMVPQLRNLFKQKYPNADITENTFTLAICNYYSDPDMYIAAHTDGNPWYPNECEDGAMFASITLYPEGEPSNNSYARFQMKPNDKWESITLPHDSILIMSSNILHRVMPHTKSQSKYFKPRINITFRSIFPKKVNPLLHCMGVSNHTRYYGTPYSIIFPKDCDENLKEMLINAYNIFNSNNNIPCLNVIVSENTKDERVSIRRKIIKDYKKKYNINTRITNNIVLELIHMILQE